MRITAFAQDGCSVDSPAREAWPKIVESCRSPTSTSPAPSQHEDRTTQTSRQSRDGLHAERGVSYRSADEAAVRRAPKQRVSAAAISVATKGRLTISEMPAAIKELASISSIDAVATRIGRSEAA